MLLLAAPVNADPSKGRTIKQKNSACTVSVSGGEYPSYTVMKAGKPIYSPASDGVVTSLISPDGKYVALSAGEISLLDIEKGEFVYGVVVVNCETGKAKGYRKNQPTLITKWASSPKFVGEVWLR